MLVQYLTTNPVKLLVRFSYAHLPLCVSSRSTGGMQWLNVEPWRSCCHYTFSHTVNRYCVVHSTNSPSVQPAPSTLCTVPLLLQTMAVSLSSVSITIPEVLVGRASYGPCALCCARANPAVTTAPTT